MRSQNADALVGGSASDPVSLGGSCHSVVTAAAGPIWTSVSDSLPIRTRTRLCYASWANHGPWTVTKRPRTRTGRTTRPTHSVVAVPLLSAVVHHVSNNGPGIGPLGIFLAVVGVAVTVWWPISHPMSKKLVASALYLAALVILAVAYVPRKDLTAAALAFAGAIAFAVIGWQANRIRQLVTHRTESFADEADDIANELSAYAAAEPQSFDRGETFRTATPRERHVRFDTEFRTRLHRLYHRGLRARWLTKEDRGIFYEAPEFDPDWSGTAKTLEEKAEALRGCAARIRRGEKR